MANLISIRVTGLKEVQEMLSRLPENMRVEVGQKGVLSIAENLKRRVGYRYNIIYGNSMSSTGLGLRSMQVRPTERGAIFEISAPYLTILEKGARDHWVSPNIIAQHRASPGSTVGLTAKKMGLTPYWGPPVYWHWQGPFVAPALESLRQDIPNILKQSIDNAIKKSRGRK